MSIKTLVGTGDRIIELSLPFTFVGVSANLLWPHVFAMNFALRGLIVGIFLLLVGAPVWAIAFAQMLRNVPRGRLMTSGPYALMLHPLYSSIAVFVIPGLGLLFNTWLGFAVGAILYLGLRVYAPYEERVLLATFGGEYLSYRSSVMFPWL